MRYFIELSYNGSGYHGWQIQPKALTVQEVLEDALSTVLNDKISVAGAGRTDTGVHAIQMFAHFDTNMELNPNDLVYKLNSFLPFNIAIADVFKVKPDAHARFDAVRRSYLYRISLRKNVFTHRNAYYIKQPLDLEKMNAAAKILFEYKDFQCFSKTHTDVKTYYCNIMKARWFTKDNEIQFSITADRFLRNMVRAIVGTMINVGLGKIEVADLHNIIQSKSRSEAGYSVPAHGLYLTDVVYPETIKL
ncbi:tRNA pseudouridine38-40 synthase [Hyunsoonleella jejuensis]|uniref:tRNA pseudouridine synthase A n=1 Tax=Hyunsoonleella jejuensis TaxID=419940 RepID=A0A1H9JKF6_9FLAO|nr:tRNA pseudouridine(38-40) synthase TruA [Hyunsoonleella jejuensis]SEQ87228.1 tRNA pseudouridine38-40 synthase [Hyunsoonleella jejuensis]